MIRGKGQIHILSYCLNAKRNTTSKARFRHHSAKYIGIYLQADSKKHDYFSNYQIRVVNRKLYEVE